MFATHLKFKETACYETTSHAAGEEIEGYSVVTSEQLHATGFYIPSGCGYHCTDR